MYWNATTTELKIYERFSAINVAAQYLNSAFDKQITKKLLIYHIIPIVIDN